MNTRSTLLHRLISTLLVLVMLAGPGLSIAEMSSAHCQDQPSALVDMAADEADCCCDDNLPCDMNAGCITICSLLATHALLPKPGMALRSLPISLTQQALPDNLPPPLAADLDRPPRISAA